LNSWKSATGALVAASVERDSLAGATTLLDAGSSVSDSSATADDKAASVVFGASVLAPLEHAASAHANPSDAIRRFNNGGPSSGARQSDNTKYVSERVVYEKLSTRTSCQPMMIAAR
jgi:hypothetical protein